MKNRCLNPQAFDFWYYGNKGITIPAHWHTYEGFVADMGLRPDGLTLDRKDTLKSYSKDNCQWADRRMQSRNRPYTLDLQFNGVTRKTWEWADFLKLRPKTIYMRLWRHQRGEITYAQVFTHNPRAKI
mgnify:CR=1 FL=1